MEKALYSLKNIAVKEISSHLISKNDVKNQLKATFEQSIIFVVGCFDKLFGMNWIMMNDFWMTECLNDCLTQNKFPNLMEIAEICPAFKKL